MEGPRERRGAGGWGWGGRWRGGRGGGGGRGEAGASPAGPAGGPTTAAPEVPPSKEDAAAAAAEASWTKGRSIAMQYFRPMDKRGLNVFETTKVPGAEFTGFKLDFNAQFP